jgi:transposase
VALTFPQGQRKFVTAIGAQMTKFVAQIGARMQSLVAGVDEEWSSLHQRIDALNEECVEHAPADEAVRRLVSIRGVGPMTATTLRAAVDDASAFSRARDLAAWLGLAPRQYATGGRPKLPGISEWGNAYLRVLFIHGAPGQS